MTVQELAREATVWSLYRIVELIFPRTLSRVASYGDIWARLTDMTGKISRFESHCAGANAISHTRNAIEPAKLGGHSRGRLGCVSMEILSSLSFASKPNTRLLP